MNCNDYKKSIFLYAELSTLEKAEVDMHIKGCDNCFALFHATQKMQISLNRIAQVKVAPENAAKLTRAIMTKINGTTASKWHHFFTLSFHSPSLKISLSLLSALIIVTFSLESFNHSILSKQFLKQPSQGSVTLDSKVFREKASQRKGKASFFVDCLSPFKSNQYSLECLKNKFK